MKWLPAVILLCLVQPALASNSAVKRNPCNAGVKSCDQWPLNVFTVTNHYTNADCSAANLATDGARVDACTGPGTANPSLNGFDGADIQWALTQCQAAGGCALDLGCNTYENAENTIFNVAPTADSGRNGVAYAAGFQNGLDIFGRRAGSPGCAAGTKLRSRNGSTGPGWDATFPTAAIFFLHQWDPSGEPTRGLPRVRFRDFECDGESDLQPSQETIGGSYLANDAYQFHKCIDENLTNTANQFTALEVTGLNVHHFEGTGILVGDATMATVTNNTVSNIGCWMDYPGTGVGALPHVCDLAGSPFTSISDTCLNGGTGCRPACTAQYTCPTCSTVWINGTAVDGEVECGCASGQPNCFGWMVGAEHNPVSGQSPGLKTVASYGIMAEGRGRSVIQGNTVSYATKYGIVHSLGAGGTTGTDEDTSIIQGNTVSHSTVGIEMGTQSVDTTVTGNNITQGGLNGNFCTANFGIQANGIHRQIFIDSNTIASVHCAGIGITSHEGYAGRTRDVIITNNVISGSGDWGPIQNVAAYGHSMISFAPNVADAPCAGAEFQNPSSLVIENNTLTTGMHGFAGLQIARALTLTCPANVADPVLLTGNAIGLTDWAANINDMGRVLGLNIAATGMVLNGDGTAGRTFTWRAGSTGTCSGFVKNGNPNPATVTDSSGNGIGICP